jgi:hypothetical protein
VESNSNFKEGGEDPKVKDEKENRNEATEIWTADIRFMVTLLLLHIAFYIYDDEIDFLPLPPVPPLLYSVGVEATSENEKSGLYYLRSHIGDRLGFQISTSANGKVPHSIH